MQTQTVCGIDLGTQSCKLVIYDFENKKIIAQSQAPVPQHTVSLKASNPDPRAIQL